VERTVRHAEPGDYEALHRIVSGPKAEAWRKRIADSPDDLFSLVACPEGEQKLNIRTSHANFR
jgi:hypothetical protein